MAKLKILVVEDETIIAMEIKHRLVNMGYEVPLTTASGEEALNLIKEDRPDLVLMDIMLKGELDGIQTAEHIYSEYNIPIVYLTAYSDDATVQRAKLTQPFGYIIKPFEEHAMRTTLEMAIYNHQLDTRLKESEEKYRNLFENAQVGIYCAYTSGEIVEANKSLIEMLGYNSIKDLKDQSLHKIRATGQADFKIEMERSGELRNFESKWMCNDGSLKFIRENAKIINVKSTGDVFIEGIVEDISSQKRAEKKEAMLKMALEQAVEMIVMTDIRGRIIYVNPAFEKVSGYSRSEVMGKNPRILKSQKNNPDDYKDLWAKISCGDIWHGHLVNKKKNGEFYEVEVIISPVRDDSGKIVNYVAVNRDVTNERIMEAQLSQATKMEAIGLLAGGVAHDFNNILTVINGYSELSLARASGMDSLQSNLKGILKASQKAEALTRQLLGFSRKQIIRPVNMNINRTIYELDKMLRRLIGEDIDMRLDLRENIGLIKADPGQVEQLLVNLVVNARDAIDANSDQSLKREISIGTKEINLDESFVSIHPGSKRGRHVVLSVADTGKGMDEATLARIFEPFFTTKEMGKGTGLGLATTYGIVKQNEGCIYAASEVDEGTHFTIYWPVLEGKIQNHVITDTPGDMKRGSEDILFVEDDADLRKIICLSLKELGYNVIEAANGIEALESVQQNKNNPALVITDIIMPEMGGKKLADELSKINPQIKILYTSGYTDDHIVHSGVLDKDVQFIQKPYSSKVLSNRIRSILEERGPQAV